MTDADFVRFLRAVAPRLGLRASGFRNVRSTVRKRVARRMALLRTVDVEAYLAYLEAHSDEWAVVDAMCRLPISRMYRDPIVFEHLLQTILPECAGRARMDARAVSVWSAGCASGEEPFTLSIGWQLDVAPAFPQVALDILATDIDRDMLDRAHHGCFSDGSLREVPARVRREAFVQEGSFHRVRDEFRTRVRFRQADLRTAAADEMFDVVSCRNVAFTYFDETLQRSVVERITKRLYPGGALVLGLHETLPTGVPELIVTAPSVYRRALR